MDAVTVNGGDVTSPNHRSAIVDSGTSLLVGPADSVAAITANCTSCYENFEGEGSWWFSGLKRGFVRPWSRGVHHVWRQDSKFLNKT